MPKNSNTCIIESEKDGEKLDAGRKEVRHPPQLGQATTIKVT